MFDFIGGFLTDKFPKIDLLNDDWSTVTNKQK